LSIRILAEYWRRRTYCGGRADDFEEVTLSNAENETAREARLPIILPFEL
jgi:hypothetical protein